MSNRFHNQPGLEWDQPGLEVAPEPEPPQAISGPQIIEKPHGDTAQYSYGQQPQAYAASYPPTGYAPSSQPTQSHWGSSQSGAYINDGVPPNDAPPNRPTILGIPRRKFWLIFSPLIVLLVVGLAVGLGAGLGTAHKSGSDATTTAAPTPIVCPNSNGTIYQASGEDPFLVVCNVDYNGNAPNSGTTDIGSKGTNSIESCIDLCSANSACVGAGWGSYQGQNTCWMKGALGASQSADNWYFVFRQQKSK
ncbi:uncharacterized protein GGS22DRAFT_18074 [Annulohypoxylon maeteangense]|uniref:uncharacterized protein n=1 Tax=Annulohypoxylon maeteangense TaxID=1927788 RepID=UPI0020089FF8|nr:uncharacterized protein GGS22DRAFT_18074 [Annulohypoxylon maeteangense]KAI0890765.1 hypothetical protein GGS22DRAFT_18074 [Annulohypoxylon maeteangense]